MAPLPRTPDETVARLNKVADSHRDLFGVERSRLLESLPWSHAQQFFRPDAGMTEEKWESERVKTTEETIAKIHAYLRFAWGKANSCRGLSAQRSIAHFTGLIWTLGPEHDEFLWSIELTEMPGDDREIDGEIVEVHRLEYAFYGKPALVAISERFKWNPVEGETDGHGKPLPPQTWRDIDDGKWRNSETDEGISATEALGH